MNCNKKKSVIETGKNEEDLQNSAIRNGTPMNKPEGTLFGIRADILVCLFLGILTLAVYWQVTNHEFVNFDDPAYVTNNRHVLDGLTPKSISWSFGFKDKDNIYYPLTWLSHILDCHLYGLNPGMHHLTSLIFHIANSLLLFLALKRMTGALWKSALVAALFALHPLNVDSVAWVAERKNVLSTFFWMLTMLTYSTYSERPGAYRYLLTLSVFALGLLSKAMLVTMPFVLLLLDYWPLNRLRQPSIPSALHLIAEKIPFLVLSALSIYVSTAIIEGARTVISFEQVSMELRITNALVSYVAYIWKTIWPQNLSVHYPYPEVLLLWKSVCAGLLLLLVSLSAFLSMKRKPYLLVGWLWFLGTLVPVMGLKQFGLWPAMADRWAYVPIIGLFIMVAWGAPELAAQWHRKKTKLALTATVILLFLIVLTRLQLGFWANSITLFEHAILVTTNNKTAHCNLGVALTSQSRFNEAADQYSKAIQITPTFVDAHYNLGIVLMKQGRTDEAIKHYSEALRLNPSHAEAHSNLGIALTKVGRTDEAINHFFEAQRIDPGYAAPHYNLGIELSNKGKISEAIEHFTESLRLNPEDAKAHNKLGSVLLKKGRTDEAISHFSDAVRTDPDFEKAHNNLGNIFLVLGDLDKAYTHYSEAVRIKPDYAVAHSGLGMVLVAQGRTDEAIDHFFEALRTDPEHTDTHYNLGIALAKKGRISESIRHLSECLRIAPDYAKAHNAMGFALAEHGDTDEGVRHYQKALKINPELAEAHNGLGVIRAKQNRMGEAINHFSEALRIDPNNRNAQANLKNALKFKK